ncbi:hypothetical protein [Persicirhabdus sediminis]|uniref:Uncharacterized protein n=1 Tax=Persicirhabdus sediminis TaxID=454144 RepID=A0A8J7MFN5_9BACT|nr:hypothetical protein [Persicirhabdus sediminis]MBK1791858.1 hypothetical protein [Persicirhabdus sediminis]
MDEYPVSPFVDALQSVFGRVFLLFVLVAGGCGIGSAYADASWEMLGYGVASFPFILLGSVFTADAFFALPVIVVFSFFFVRFEWHLLSLLVPFFLATYAGAAVLL